MDEKNNTGVPDGGKEPSGEDSKSKPRDRRIHPDIIIRKAERTLSTGVPKLGRSQVIIKKVNRKLKKLLPGSQAGKVEYSGTGTCEVI